MTRTKDHRSGGLTEQELERFVDAVVDAAFHRLDGDHGGRADARTTEQVMGALAAAFADQRVEYWYAANEERERECSVCGSIDSETFVDDEGERICVGDVGCIARALRDEPRATPR